MAFDPNNFTVADFKDRFPRDFAYLPEWDNTETYNTGDVVFYDVTGLFYEALNNGVTSVPTDTNDWEQISDSKNNYIQDSDITRALDLAILQFNKGIIGREYEAKLSFLYLTAFYLVENTKMALAGISSSGASFPVNNKSVGNVSESFTVPEQYTKSPVLSYYTSNQYGVFYLNIIYPRTRGTMKIASGGTQP